jgi:hypothetical protein
MQRQTEAGIYQFNLVLRSFLPRGSIREAYLSSPPPPNIDLPWLRLSQAAVQFPHIPVPHMDKERLVRTALHNHNIFIRRFLERWSDAHKTDWVCNGLEQITSKFVKQTLE